MSDPFEGAKAIRRGERDGEMPSFEEITGWIQRVPVTWLPGLLAMVVECNVARETFQNGKMIPFVERVAMKAGTRNFFRQEEG